MEPQAGTAAREGEVPGRAEPAEEGARVAAAHYQNEDGISRECLQQQHATAQGGIPKDPGRAEPGPRGSESRHGGPVEAVEARPAPTAAGDVRSLGEGEDEVTGPLPPKHPTLGKAGEAVQAQLSIVRLKMYLSDNNSVLQELHGCRLGHCGDCWSLLPSAWRLNVE